MGNPPGVGLIPGRYQVSFGEEREWLAEEFIPYSFHLFYPG